MDIKSIIIKLKPNLKTISINNYVRYINILHRKDADSPNTPIKNLDFLLDVDQINKRFTRLTPKKTYKNNETTNATIRSYLAPVILLLNEYYPDSEALIKFNELNQKLKNKYQEKVDKFEKSENETKNWMSLKELNEIREKLETKVADYGKLRILTNMESRDLDYYLIASLYLLNPPVRLNYYNMKVYRNKEIEDLPKDENYLLINKGKKKQIILNDYKTGKNYSTQIIPVNAKLNRALNLYLKFNKGNIFPVSQNVFSKMVSRTFTHEDGRSVKINLLRHIYITENTKVDVKQLKKNKELAKKMGHSSATQLAYNRI